MDKFSWSKLPLEQRYNYGIYIAICTLATAVGTLFSVIISQNHEIANINEKAAKKSANDNDQLHKRDSLENALLKEKLDKSQNQVLELMQKREFENSEIIKKLEEFNAKNHVKN